MSKKESMKKKVIIKWLAYSKMMKHVLRFGSNAKDNSQYKEVMGVLIGHLADEPGIIKNVIIEDAVPVSHGGHVEVTFKPEDYGSFSIIDYEYSEQNWFSVGWYHSHPGLSCFFSAVDIRNQMGWQGPNPSAVGIVWDHTRLGGDDGDMGFDVYRLDNPQNSISGYHEIEWIIEPPDSLEFFKNGIIELITNIQKGEPPILEINEVPDVFGDFTVPKQSAVVLKVPKLIYEQDMESLKGEFENFYENFIQPLVESINEWNRKLVQVVIDKNLIIHSDIKDLKDNLSKIMSSLQSWFKFAINESLTNLETYFGDKFEFSEKQRRKIDYNFNEYSINFNKILSDSFESSLKDVTKNFTEQMISAIEKLKKISTTSEEIESSINIQIKSIQTSFTSNKEKMGEIKKDSNLQTVKSEIENLQKQVENIKKSLKVIIGKVKGGN